MQETRHCLLLKLSEAINNCHSTIRFVKITQQIVILNEMKDLTTIRNSLTINVIVSAS